MFTLQTSFKPLLVGGGGLNPLVDVTVNSKEENSKDFCPKLRPRIRSLMNNKCWRVKGKLLHTKCLITEKGRPEVGRDA